MFFKATQGPVATLPVSLHTSPFGSTFLGNLLTL